MNKITQLILIILVIFLLPDNSESACGMRPYIFYGKVLNETTNEPIPDAIVYTFLDNQKNIYSNGYTTQYPDFAVSDKEGKFIASSYYKTYVSYTQDGHDCSAVAKVVEFVVSAKGFMSVRKKVNIEPHIINPDTVTMTLKDPIKLNSPMQIKE